jgi:hypothetical protein
MGNVMRGKIVVGLIGLLAVIGFIANLWFVNTRSAIDQRFNLKRQSIAKDINTAFLLPERIGDFMRKSLTPIEANSSGDLEGSAAYADTDGKQLLLSVRKPGRGVPGLEALTNGQYTLHSDTQFPFGYSEVNGPAFVWINGDWVIGTSTAQATSEALLQFANAYPY